MNHEGRDPKETRDDIATLLRLAGKRRPVPPARADRVRAAAREQWRAEVRHRSRRRYAWTAVAVAAAASILLAAGVRMLPTGEGLTMPGNAMNRVESVIGSAWVRTTAEVDAPRRAVALGDGVAAGSEVATGPNGRTALRLASGHSVRLDVSTRIRLLDEEHVALDSGALYVDSGFGSTGTGGLVIQTPLGMVQEIGTQFELRVDGDAVRVRLREGAVVVRHAEATLEVAAGSEVELDSAGKVTRRSLLPHDPEWEWIVDITPMLDLEGRSAKVFLEWVARERGWKLAFADENVARAAEDTILSGALGRLTLDEALDAVLPTCRMTYHVEDGVLVIAAGTIRGAGGRSAPIRPPGHSRRRALIHESSPRAGAGRPLQVGARLQVGRRIHQHRFL